MNSISRTMLYVPANSWRMIKSAIAGKPDAIILDLEDAVPPEEKETARVFSRDTLHLIKENGISAFVRINSLSSGLIEEDLSYIVNEHLDGVMLPKSETVNDIKSLEELLKKEEEKKGLAVNNVRLLPLIESPVGINNAMAIGSGSKRVLGLAFGAGDYLREMGVGFSVTKLKADEYYSATLYARSRLAITAKILGFEAIDTPFFGLLIDVDGLIKECEAVKLLGFSGKQLIHPKHIQYASKVFSPSEEDIDYAKSMILAYEESMARGAGSASYGGRMIDNAMYKMGKELLSTAEAITQKGESLN